MKDQKHHYIPVFYLKQWMGADGRLCEMSRPYKRVEPRRTAPKGTGYVRDLYTIPGLPPEKAQILETIYLKSVDDWAVRALRILVKEDAEPGEMSDPLKYGWARFVYSMILRNPEYLARATALLAARLEESVEAVRDKYSTLRSADMPESFDEYKVEFMANPANSSPNNSLHRMIQSERVIRTLSAMKWWTINVSKAKHRLLTSDRPVIMTNGFGRPNAHIAMPMSPHEMFFATADEQTFRNVRRMNANELVLNSNVKVTEQARKLVYGTSDAQIMFVEKRLGKMIPASPLETAVLPQLIKS